MKKQKTRIEINIQGKGDGIGAGVGKDLGLGFAGGITGAGSDVLDIINGIMVPIKSPMAVSEILFRFCQNRRRKVAGSDRLDNLST